ncbi:ABC transporter permease [Anaeromicropila herbilytica]|uniref:ABC3 transporter permease C-terminal domain-containing protein n=1 Tax=Anaeromicropila herbilytica TaxID=2785025 RepID=A0A7R7EQ95_9FIRM|nr:ABC transporter permease [Anaeromicropila herbilytica]BCN32969.1 hypothetical protein bsdtb5_42640 [Anaeromicropila herbilytica]
MKILMIAKSNIRKNKGISVMLMILILIATILLYTAVSILLDINTFVDDKNKELNGADYVVGLPSEYKDAAVNTLKELKGYQYSELEDVVLTSSGDIRNVTNDEKKQSTGYAILNADKKENLSKLKIIDKGNKKLENSIIVPYFLKVANGYHTGDTIEIGIGNKTKNYVIYGFAEDIIFATPTNITFYKCYVFDKEFNSLMSEQKQKITFIKAKLERGTKTDQFDTTFIKHFNAQQSNKKADLLTLDYATMKIGLCLFLSIIMAILIVFSIIIIVIVLTVMRFTIVSHIESNIKNIGSMQAMGYRPYQLIMAIVLQFSIISIFGYLIGMIMASFSSGIVKNIVSSSIGLEWKSSMNLLAALVSLVLILALVSSVSYFTSRKIKMITPIIALRNGIESHNFKKSYFPLDRTPVNYNILLGLKSFFYHTKQNITIIIVVLLMSFVCIFSFAANYNFNIDTTAFLQLVGMEKAQLSVVVEDKDASNIFADIKQMKHVKKTVQLYEKNMTVVAKKKEITTLFKVCNDYNKLSINTVIKGRYPKHDNEIAATNLILKRLHAKIGDVIHVKNGEKAVEFLVVGVTQQISYLGKCAMITEEGMRRLDTSYKPSQIYVYLDSSKYTKAVSKEIKNHYKDKNISIDNVEKIIDTTLAPMQKALAILCLVCTIITLSIIALILYLFIKIRLLKERVRLGAAKAIGYTTRQLIAQVVVSFCPTCFIGALIGAVMARFLINPLVALMLSTSGIVKCHMIINPLLLFGTFFGISVFSIVITALVAVRIRKITPCELF